jgi:protein phosphatase
MASNVKIAADGLTDVGQVRSSNQDSFLVAAPEGLFIVADGMGGHAGGEIASSLAVQEIARYLKQNGEILKPLGDERTHPDARVANTLIGAVNYASTKIYERALEEPSLRGMGTTATVCRIVDGHAYVAHVGDSRCYLMRCGYIYQITNDHSLVSEQVRAGILTKEEAESHHLSNVITRSVGYQEEEDVDTTSFELEDGDVILLCSDGLTRKITDKEISLIARELETQAVKRLIAMANERGGEDNITIVILKVKVPPH